MSREVCPMTDKFETQILLPGAPSFALFAKGGIPRSHPARDFLLYRGKRYIFVST